MSIRRIGPAEKLLTVHLILDGKETQSHAADRLGINRASIQQWICIYKSDGEDAFHASKNKHYPKELKEQAVLDYLGGRGSLQEICQRYGIKSHSRLQDWIKKYNGHEELKASGTGGTAIMTKEVFQQWMHQAGCKPSVYCRECIEQGIYIRSSKQEMADRRH